MELNETRLSARERTIVVSVSVGFLIVSSLVTYLSIVYAFPAHFLGQMWDELVRLRFRSAEASGLIFLVMVVVYPVSVVVALVSAILGMYGKRTRLTSWVLREVDHEQVRKRYEESGLVQTRSDDPEKDIFLSRRVGWTIFLSFIAGGAALLAWFALVE
jgi:hypothetical protein